MKEPWILIVEDSADDANLIIHALKRNNRTEPSTICSDASEALLVLDTSETLPRLVLLDGKLPGMQSEEFINTLRLRETTRFVPVVLFSGHTHVNSVVSALAAGANSYVCKPMEFDQTMDQLGVTLRYWLDVHCSPALAKQGVQK